MSAIFRHSIKFLGFKYEKHNSHSGGAYSLTREFQEEDTDMGAISAWRVKLYNWRISMEDVYSVRTEWNEPVKKTSMVRKVEGEEVTPGARKRRDYILFIAFLFQK